MSQPSSTLRVPVQERAHKTRSLLVAAARSAFAEHGYAATTARSIAEGAKVGTGTFYHYFPDKDAVLAEICAERAQYLAAEVERIAAPSPEASTIAQLVDDARARLGRIVQLSVDYHREAPGLHAVIEERRSTDGEIRRLMLEAETASLHRLEEALGRWGRDGDLQAAAFMMFMLLEGAVHAHVLSPPVMSDDRFVAALGESLLRVALPSSLVGLPRPPSPASKESRHAGTRPRSSD